MHKDSRGKNEEGLVAIMVATIIMIILSLITIGFARLMQREQRLALDRSLSTEAFYAAESAINEAVQKIQDAGYTGDKTTCDADATFTGVVDNNIGAQYTCLKIDQSPDTLEYTQGSIGVDASKVIPVSADGGTAIAHINIAWAADSSRAGPSATSFYPCATAPTALPAFGSWVPNTGMLRLDIIPSGAATLNRDNLINNTISLYLYPCETGVNAINYADHTADASKGQIVAVQCLTGHTPQSCELSIDIPAATPIAGNISQFYVRARSIYRASDMTLRIFDAANEQIAIRDAQVLIDATGKVNDVIRRVQVRVPVHKSYQIPEFVLETTDSICKQVQVAPPSTVLNACTY